MHYRLGLDLGTNSLGWIALELNRANRPYRIIAAGSRIFSDGRDPKSKASLAVDRRTARAMRRRRDRFKQRQAALIKHLIIAGLFPEDIATREALAELDPYELRSRALHEELPLHHIGRALFHLSQRRGFKSNRKADRGKNEEEGVVRLGVAQLREAMALSDAETLGDFLYKRRKSATDQNAIPSVRTRMRIRTGDEDEAGYDFYPHRDMLEEEFNAIWEHQSLYHGDVLTSQANTRFYEVIFHQRPLKQPRVGKCVLLGDEERLPKAHPLFQQRRLLEELNALRIEAGPALTLQQRDALYLRLKDSKKATFDSMRKVLKLDFDARFNKESENRKDLKGDEIASELGHKTRFGKRWAHLSSDQQWTIVSRVRDQETDADEVALRTWLRDHYDLTPEQSLAVAGARLPEGYGRFGLTATKKLIEALRNEVIVYSDAVQKAGFGHHSDFRTGESIERLPYYGHVLERHIMPGTGEASEKDEIARIGRLTNPTVHIGLNQLQRVVNRLIDRYGRPAEIAIEIARDLKMSDEKKREINDRNRQNRAAAEKRSEKLKKIGKPDTGANRALLKLWEDLSPNVLDRRCVYTGQQISINMLFEGAVDVDHIIPFSDSWDDSNDNLLICTRSANREKGKNTPYGAFGHRGDWADIHARAARLPRGKRWRFEPDVMARFDKQGGFLARQLTDTQHLSRLAREYLSALYPEKGEGSSHVWVSPGRLTELVRRKLGLNSILTDDNIGGGADQPKNRKDHRHHTIDAFVIAIVDRGLLNIMARESGAIGEDGRERVVVPEPWEGFRDELRRVLREVVVSHRADHGTVSSKGSHATAGRLHNDTAYGLTGEKDAKGNDLVVHRVSLGALKKAADLEGVRDPDLRAALRAWTDGLDGKEFEARLLSFPQLGPPQFRNIRRLRVVEPLSVIPIRDKSGRAYKGYKGDSNYRYDVWEMKDGKWVAEVVSMFDARQPGWTSYIRRNNPTAKKVLRFHRDDILAIERNGTTELVRVVKFSEKQLAFAPPHEGGALKARAADKNDPFNYLYPSPNTLKTWKARQVRIDELGRVWDPGPRVPAARPG